MSDIQNLINLMLQPVYFYKDSWENTMDVEKCMLYTIPKIGDEVSIAHPSFIRGTVVAIKHTIGVTGCPFHCVGVLVQT